MEGKLQFHSRLILMAQVLVPCWIQFYLPSRKDLVMSGQQILFLIIDDMVATVLHSEQLLLFRYWSTFMYWSTFGLCDSKTNNTSSDKDNLLAFSCFVNLFRFTYFFFLLSLHSLKSIHFCFHHHHLALLSSTSYITAAFVLVSGHPGLKILYSTQQ